MARRETTSEPWEWRSRRPTAQLGSPSRRNREAYREYRRAQARIEAERQQVTLSFPVMLAVAFGLHLLMMAAGGILTHRQPDEWPVTIVQLRLGVTDAPDGSSGLDQSAAGDAAESGKSSRAGAREAAAARTRRSNARRGILHAVTEETADEESEAGGAAERPALGSAAATVSSGLRTRPGADGRFMGSGQGGGIAANGTLIGNAETGQAAASRYTQEISAWLERFRTDPGQGVRGRVLVRVRIDRRGRVLAKWIEHPSGTPALDAAVLAQVARANPLPVPPSNYPGGGQLEFQFPVTVGK